MATLKIEMKNAKFISHNGVNVEKFEENYVSGNGWECWINENGRVDCIATGFYKGERHQIKLKIDKGYVKVLFKIGDGRPRVLKSYKLEGKSTDGVIILPAGYIDKRRPHFRNYNFQKFLEEYGLTAVRYESANGIYRLIAEHNGHTLIFNEEIQTDGNCQLVPAPIQLDEYSELSKNTIVHMMEVKHASWVIKNVWKFGEVKHRILYTMDDPKQIVGLPKPE